MMEGMSHLHGDFLGELTYELKGHHIMEFVSAGPKNYAYKTNEDVLQGKRVQPEPQACQKINFYPMNPEVFL